MYQYAIPTPGYIYSDYTTSATTSPSSSPSPDMPYGYYIPPQYMTTTISPKKHSRSASYSTPRGQAFYGSPPPGHPAAPHFVRQPDYASPSAKHKEYVSTKTKARSHSTSNQRGGGNGFFNVSYTTTGNTVPRRNAPVRSQKQNIIVDTSDEAEESPQYTYIKPRTGQKQEKYAKLKANQHRASNQVPPRNKANDSPKTRPRRASESRPATAQASKKSSPPRREATAADAAKHRIPAGYSLKNWDPSEAPVTLLGSVFDANSVGKWIYDWTVYHHGPAAPMSDVAGDFWLLLIKLAGKMKRADDCLPRIKDYEDQEEVEEFLEAGDNLWAKFKKLVKACEEYMWKSTKKDGKKGPVVMGKNSGTEFVDSIFGRERKLEETEQLMQRIRTWNHRFDKYCEDILRHA